MKLLLSCVLLLALACVHAAGAEIPVDRPDIAACVSRHVDSFAKNIKRMPGGAEVLRGVVDRAVELCKRRVLEASLKKKDICSCGESCHHCCVNQGGDAQKVCFSYYCEDLKPKDIKGLCPVLPTVDDS